MSETVKLIIEIPKEDIELIRKTSFVEDERTMFKQSPADRQGTMMLHRLMDSVKDGIPLPKGHGRLIDADAFIATLEDASKRHKYKELLINDRLTVDDVFKAVIESLQNKGMAEGDAPTIIEADRAESEE